MNEAVPSGVRYRVHLAAVGYEVVRLTDPLIRLHADVAILITRSRQDRAREYLAKILELLGEADIPAHVVECNIKNTAEVADEIGAIVTASPANDFFFNVSTGAKTAAIAGLLGSTLWPIQPYYVPVDYMAKPVHLDRDFPVEGPPEFIPTFRVPVLDIAAVKALRFLAAQDGPAAKRTLITHLREAKIVAPKVGPRVTPQAFQGQTNSILHRLQSWDFVRLEGRGRALRIHLTAKGASGARMFKHMVETRPPPALLV